MEPSTTLLIIVMALFKFTAIVVGLFIGDYILQPKEMAVRKSEKSKAGWWICTYHCVLYTIATVACLKLSVLSLICLLAAFIVMQKILPRHDNKFDRITTWAIWGVYLGSSIILLQVNASLLIVMAVTFLSHWFMDRYSLAAKWLDAIDGRNFYEEYKAMKEQMIKDKEERQETYSEITIPFACIIYVIVDNGLHIIGLWILLMWLAFLGVGI